MPLATDHVHKNIHYLLDDAFVGQSKIIDRQPHELGCLGSHILDSLQTLESKIIPNPSPRKGNFNSPDDG